jgi:hypothetical protein
MSCEILALPVDAAFCLKIVLLYYPLRMLLVPTVQRQSKFSHIR